MDLNKVQIIGRLTRDPETRSTSGGQSVANFSVATGRQWTDKQSGEKKEQTEFHNVVAWARLADICQQYLRKGSQVYIEGRLQTRSWDDPAGVKKYRTEIIAENMIMLGGRGGNGGNGGGMAAPASAAAPAPAASNDEVTYAPVDNGNTPPAPQPAGEDTISIEDIPF